MILKWNNSQLICTSNICTINGSHKPTQVRKLEQENKVLETKWHLLQKDSKPESKLEPMLKSFISSLRAKLEQVKKDKEHLDTELRNVHAQVEEQKQRSVIGHFIFSPEPDSKLHYSVQFQTIISSLNIWLSIINILTFNITSNLNAKIMHGIAVKTLFWNLYF